MTEQPFATRHERDDLRMRRARWVAQHILPYEPRVRAWLKSRLRSAETIDDLIQDAYVRIAALDAFEAIDHPERFFLTIVRNLLIDHVRRQRIVPIESVGDLPGTLEDHDAPDPERVAGGRRELDRVLAIVASLPTRCQAIFRLRKIDGLSQREVAERLGVSEGVVENDQVKALRLLLQALRRAPDADPAPARRSKR